MNKTREGIILGGGVKKRDRYEVSRAVLGKMGVGDSFEGGGAKGVERRDVFLLRTGPRLFGDSSEHSIKDKSAISQGLTS